MDKQTFSKKLYIIFQTHSSSELFHNVTTRFYQYPLDKTKFTWATVTNSITSRNCYAVSHYGLLINYSKQEIYKISNPLEKIIFSFFIKMMSPIVKLAKIDKNQTLHNFILSTNFFSSEWENTINITHLRKRALHKFPQHSITIRSVNTYQNPQLSTKLKNDKWLPVVTRQVYILDKPNLNKRDLKKDFKLLKEDRYEFISPNIHNFEDFKKAEQLYRHLYVRKYTEENIQYTAAYLQLLFAEGGMHIRLLKDKRQNSFVGVVGIVTEGNIMTVPLIGYDLSEPQSKALYRRCSIYTIQFALNHNFLFNMSSGAPDFKKNRGATPQIEYMYVYVRHLNIYRRLIWKLLSFISLNIYKPLLIREKL